MLMSGYRKGVYGVSSPLVIIAVIYGYYCILGPYKGVLTGETFDRLLDMRPFYKSALWGSFISLGAILFGFNLNKKNVPIYSLNKEIQNKLLGYYGKRLFLIGFFLYAIGTRGGILNQINPLDAKEGVDELTGGISNYLLLSVNFLIPGVTLLFANFIRTRSGFWWVLVPFVIAMGLFITLGFRYRLVLMLGAMGISFYLFRGKKPNPIVLSAGIFFFIVFMGIMNMTRQYGRGLNLEKLEGGTEKYYSQGMEEARIFQTSGAVIDIIPAEIPFVGLEPVISTILFPIPRAIFPAKGSAQYLFNTLDAIYGAKVSKGAACLMFAEYYMMFGWPSLIIGCFLIGWFSRKLWNWFLANKDNPLIVVAYAQTVVFLYMIISRGYLPQVTMLFFFSVFPVFVILRMAKKKYGSKHGLKKVIHDVS